MAGPFEDWFREIPPVTRAYCTACLVTTIMCQLNYISPLMIFLNYPVIVHDYQIWRLITNFFFFDSQIRPAFIFHMYFLRRLEENSFRDKTADFLFMWFFGGLLLLAVNWFLFYSPVQPKILFLGPSLSFMFVYVWSKRNPYVRWSLLGLFQFNAPYLPWVIMGFDVVLGMSFLYDLLGIIAGHFYCYLTDVLPVTYNIQLLRTPSFLKRIFDPTPVAPHISEIGERPHNE